MTAPDAAFFDLDRTLVPVASPKIFQRHLAAAGLAESGGNAVTDVFFTLFELAGESAIVGRTAKLAPRAAIGWSVADTIAAAGPAADEIVEHVSDFARAELDMHRDAGRTLVLATTTPEHLVRPLADRLGIDDVIATKWSQKDGRFTGTVEGDVVWGPGKRDAVVAWCRDRVPDGVEHIPAEGGAIIVANHRSEFDPLVMITTVARSGRNARYMGKREVFDLPVIGPLLQAGGGIPVDRGSGNDEPLQAAAAAVAGGDLVVMFPQGTIPRGRAFFDPVLKARWGAARLAAMTEAPVIPVGLWGTDRVWPRNASLPSFNLSEPPEVTSTVGAPVALKHRSPARDTERIMAAVSELLPEQAREPYEPTDEELARTYPPGKGDDLGFTDR